ncbi:hypothetical protein [Hoeflea poritis]|uniref:Uncharacterized protein n=1 Tax=Hoeflea poritis TaxID=2993659 RepID=A0ABT4VJG5_9HYPH|nr:hypothetical protein [Hoeflea poritis]MDA4844836.1 hypothetical protein [Hoeflea poritis]
MRQIVLPTTISALCLCTGAATPAHAGPKYDRKIEQAAITIVAGKLGMIRGTHKIGEPHYLYPPIHARSAEDGTLEPAPLPDAGVFAIDFDGFAER